MRTRSKRTIACARATAGLEWQQIRLSQPDISMQAQPAIARLRTRSSRYSASALGPAGASASPADEIPRPHPTCLRPLAVALRAEDVHQYLRRVVGLDGRDHEVEGRGRYGEARALAEGLHPPRRPSSHGHAAQTKVFFFSVVLAGRHFGPGIGTPHQTKLLTTRRADRQDESTQTQNSNLKTSYNTHFHQLTRSHTSR